jgi:hypothetical protein
VNFAAVVAGVAALGGFRLVLFLPGSLLLRVLLDSPTLVASGSAPWPAAVIPAVVAPVSSAAVHMMQN